ncbi:MAG: exopolysaccharide biosynthesis protein [Clostridiaceae bacterium]|nr:exopolysaccharide biosynthesis protein [Clostridiaceae bacterium]
MPALAAEEAVQTPVVEEEVESTSIIEEDTEPLVEEETEPLVEGDTEPAPVEEEIEPPPVEEDTESTPIIDVIYQTAESKTITSGVTLDIITRFTEFGWQKIYVMKADLNDPYVHIDALTSSETIQKPLTVTDHMLEWGAIAAINGSFFLASEQPGNQNLIGPMIQAQSLKTADASFNSANDSMATFAINKEKKSIFSYWKTDISLYAPNGEQIKVTRYNEPFWNYEDFTIIDRNWRTMSVGTQNGYYHDIIEMVVENGIVKEIRQSLPATEIPINGYVVITRKAYGHQILDNFKVGEPVAFDITTTPDWKELKMAVTGGAMLVVDGVIPESFSHTVNGRHPRTAVGSTEDGKTLFMVAVDGRQSQSIGMTMEELAHFMREIGAYNALCMDGGGSTTLAAREPGTVDIAVQNSPSDGVQRRIPNGIGVFSFAPPSPLAGLYIETIDTNTFVNTTRAFTVKGYDQYFNPVIIDPEEVTWKIEGVEGSFTDNVLKPSTAGQGKVIATVGDVSAELPVQVFGEIAKLTLSHRNLKLISKERSNFTVIGINGSGDKAVINPNDISWTTTGGIGFFSSGTFVSTNPGYGYICASVGDVNAYCAVTVLPTQSIQVDNFEKQNASFLSYPSTVAGSYSISNEQKHSGNYSGKLSYVFEEAETSRAVYAELSNGGISLPENAIRVGIWVYNERENSNWLRVEVRDKNNRVYRLGDLTKLDWKGWRYVEIPLNGVPMPAKLTRIYLVQVNPVAEVGAVYFDDLSIITVEREKMTQDTKIKQRDTKVIHSFEEENNISFSSYPSWVPGGVEISDEYSNTGLSSARLDYVFKETPETQAAYLMLGENGISIPNGTETIGLWAYSQRFTKSWLRAEVFDANGKKHYVMFAEGISWTGWKYVEGNIAHIPKPARVTRLYVVNPKPINEEGHIYLDDLQFNVKTDRAEDFNNLPEDTVPVDPKNQAVTYEKGEYNYRFSVFGEDREPSNDVERYLTDFLADKINKYIEIGAFVGSGPHSVANIVNNPTLATGTGFRSFDMLGSRFIQLDMSSKSIRLSAPEQWKWLLEQLDSFEGQNIFLFLESSLDNFSDKKEAELFKDILGNYAKNKFDNVWVFFKGGKNSVELDRGVRYFSSAGFDVKGLSAENKDAAKYILVTIMGDQVTYQYKPIE